MITIDISKKPKVNSTNVGITAEKNSITKQADTTCENNDSITIHDIFTSNQESTKRILHNVEFNQNDTSQ